MGVFNAFTGKASHSSHRITVGPDSFADISLIAPAAVHPKWNTVTVPQFSVRGIGGLSSPVSTRRTNPHIRKLVENVRFHHSLTQDAARFRRMWDDTPVELNAKHYGSPSARPRQYMADFVNLHELHHQPPLSPNAILSTNRFCDSPHMPCIVAAEHTYNVPTVTDTVSKRRTRLTISECEQMMGWPAGITRRPSCPDEPYATQLQRIGNALNNHQLHHILKHLHRNLPASAVWPVQVEMLLSLIHI